MIEADIILNNASALLEECLDNGMYNKHTLYAWFCSEENLIRQTMEELNWIILERKELNECETSNSNA